MISKINTNIALKNFPLRSEIGMYCFAESRLLCRMMKAPEAPTDGSEEADSESENTDSGKSIEKTKADTSQRVRNIAGKQMNQQAPLDLRPKQAAQKPSTFRHVVAAKNNIPTVGEIGKTAITAGSILVPPALLAVGAGIGVRNIWQRFRGVPKEQRVGLTGSAREGLRSMGKTAVAPFKMAGNLAKFGAEGAVRTADTLIGKPARGVWNMFNYGGSILRGKDGSETAEDKKNLLRQFMKGVGSGLYNISSLTWKIPMGLVNGLIKVADDAWEKPIRTGIGVLIIGAGGAALTLAPNAVAAAVVGAINAGGALLNSASTAISAYIKLKMAGVPI